MCIRDSDTVKLKTEAGVAKAKAAAKAVAHAAGESIEGVADKLKKIGS